MMARTCIHSTCIRTASRNLSIQSQPSDAAEASKPQLQSSVSMRSTTSTSMFGGSVSEPPKDLGLGLKLTLLVITISFCEFQPTTYESIYRYFDDDQEKGMSHKLCISLPPLTVASDPYSVPDLDFYENFVASFLTIFSCDSVDTTADNNLALQAGLVTSLVWVNQLGVHFKSRFALPISGL